MRAGDASDRVVVLDRFAEVAKGRIDVVRERPFDEQIESPQSTAVAVPGFGEVDRGIDRGDANLAEAVRESLYTGPKFSSSKSMLLLLFACFC